MSDVAKVDITGLRKRLVAILIESTESRDPQEGSLYLRAMTCCWLAAAEGSTDERWLEKLYREQAEAEGIDDADQLLTDIIMLGMP